MPYVFTEQGIAMLSAVLRSDIAIQVSIQIMNTFVEMRRFVSTNAVLFERIETIELKQLEYQRQSERKFDRIFDYMCEHVKPQQKIFFDGQIYDAFSLFVDIIQSAEKSILLIGNYVDVSTLNLLSKKENNVDVCIYTSKMSRLTEKDITLFNKQYPHFAIEYIKSFHDRFLILDDERTYHIKAS